MRRPRNGQLRGLAYADTSPHGELCVAAARGYVTLEIRRGNERRGHAITASYAYLMTRFYGSKGRAQRATLPVGGGLALLYA